MSGMGREFGAIKQMDIFRRFGLAAACFLIVATFLGMTLIKMVQQRTLQNTVKSVLTSEFAEYPATGIDGILLDKRGKKLFVLAELHTPSQITPDQVSIIENELAALTKTSTELIVHTFKSTDITSTGSNSPSTAQSLDGFFVSPITPIKNLANWKSDFQFTIFFLDFLYTWNFKGKHLFYQPKRMGRLNVAPTSHQYLYHIKYVLIKLIYLYNLRI